MSSPHAAAPYYFVPGPSKWPLFAGRSLLVTMIGASGWVNGAAWGPILNIGGILATILVLYFWFGDAIGESESGKYNKRIDASFRWSMSWFIFSEVMFFAAFFGALFYARAISLPWLGDLDHKIIWPDFAAQWGDAPAGTIDPFQKMGPFWIPTINTALLLLSGVTLTISHHALRAGHRTQTAIWLFATILLGAIFMGFQVYEYMHAYSAEVNLKLTSGIYGSTFYMLTGFHGFHVTLGAIMLSVVLYRVLRGHFTAENHFGFEGAAWYWHFVDVVWLGLYIVVYWL